MLGLLGHRGHERHRGRAAADHHDAVAGVVEVGGPVLRVHHPAPEVLSSREVHRMAPVVAVVTGAQEQEGTGVRARLALLADLDAHVRQWIAGYKVPRSLWLVDEISRSPSGKPDYQWAKRHTETHDPAEVGEPSSATRPS